MKPLSAQFLFCYSLLLFLISSCGDSTSSTVSGSLPGAMDFTIDETTYHFAAGIYHRLDIYSVRANDTTIEYQDAPKVEVKFDSITRPGTYYTTMKAPVIYITFTDPRNQIFYSTNVDSSATIAITQLQPNIIGSFKGKLQQVYGNGKQEIDIKGTFNVLVF